MAIGKKYSHESTECKSCGLCHQGCPYDCMFSSSHLLKKFNLILNLTILKIYLLKKLFLEKI